MTRTARGAMNEEKRDMDQVIDNPTRFTRNALRFTPATKAKLSASIEVKDLPGRSQHYLTPLARGGGRRHKGFERWLIGAGIMRSNEYAIPASGIRLNAAGNVTKGQLNRILSELPRKGGKFFVAKEGGHLPRGIYRRRTKTKIIPVFIFETVPNYSRDYPFRERIASRVQRLLPIEYVKALNEIRI